MHEHICRSMRGMERQVSDSCWPQKCWFHQNLMCISFVQDVSVSSIHTSSQWFILGPFCWQLQSCRWFESIWASDSSKCELTPNVERQNSQFSKTHFTPWSLRLRKETQIYSQTLRGLCLDLFPFLLWSFTCLFLSQPYCLDLYTGVDLGFPWRGLSNKDTEWTSEVPKTTLMFFSFCWQLQSCRCFEKNWAKGSDFMAGNVHVKSHSALKDKIDNFTPCSVAQPPSPSLCVWRVHCQCFGEKYCVEFSE